MYGTVAQIKVQPGRMDELQAMVQEFGATRGSTVKGFVAGYLYRLDNDPDGAIMAVVFEDKTSYLANADDPEQDKEFRRLRECMAADPVWHDGTVVSM